MAKRKYNVVFLLFLFITLSLGFAASLGQSSKQTPKPAPAAWSGDYASGWQQFEQLTKDQKYEAASALVENMLADARSKKNSSEWTRCLIRYTQLRMALHGYETSVRFLKDQPWPEDMTGSSVLNLYYAQALTTYARSYSWEINRRERVDTKGVVDLKAWTRDQIYEEAQKAFEIVWKLRGQLGEFPNTQWKEYLTPNNYPAGIRPTLRDAVSYLRAEMLADTNGWQPDQLNEIYRLKLANLVSGDAGEISLIDPAKHPLEKICFILADLENWHARRKEREAALEARLERYRQIYQHFTDAEDRKLIRSDLEKQLKPLADASWWSEGMAQLAEFTQSDSEPDALIRARQIAIQGEKAYPGSIGARHCLAIRDSIEYPDYSLTGMQNDNPKKKSLLINYSNLDKIFFRAYAIDLLKTIETSNDSTLLPAGRELENLVVKNTPAHQWEVPLPRTSDYRNHKVFVIPPMVKSGIYLVVASARPGFPKNDNRLQAMYMTVGNLALVSRREAGAAEITVLNGSNGRPVAGAEVMLYQYDWKTRHHRAYSKVSDARGIVQLVFSQQNNSYFLVARYGDQITFDPQALYPYAQNTSGPSISTLIYTDRSIYRPLQKILWKAVPYKRGPDRTRFETSPGSTFVVSLKDLNQQVVESKTVTANSFGTASGEFTIPAGRALGYWHLESSWGPSQTGIRVEEYKRPTFETKMLDPDKPLRLNQTAQLKGEAKYYFGLPVSGGQVKWVVRRQAMLPWWWGYYSIRDSGRPSSGSHVIASGVESLKDDGTFSLTFLPEIDERLGKNPDITYRYSVSADVTDEGGETRTAQRSFRLGFVSVEASAELEKPFFLQKDPIKITVLRASLDGIPKAGKGTWKILSLKGPAEALLPADQPIFEPKQNQPDNPYQTPGDRERERWRHLYNPEAVLMQWPEASTQASGSLSHDDSGRGEIPARRLDPGAYRLLYETIDDFGAKCEMRKNFIVAADFLQLPLPAMFAVESSPVKAGGTARILAHSGFKDQFAAIEIYRDGNCIRRKEIVSGKDPSLIEIPITEADRGGLGITMTLVRDNQLIQLQGAIMVPWDDKELKVEFSTFRDRLRPGRDETWSVKVTGPAGKDVAVSAAELLAYMYDRSLDAFAPHAPISPLNLYPYRAGYIPARANLSEASRLWLNSQGFNRGGVVPSLTKDRLVFYSGYGIGGVAGGVVGGVPGGVRSALRMGGNVDSATDRKDGMEVMLSAEAPAPILEASSSTGTVMKQAIVVQSRTEPLADKKETEGETGRPIELRSDFSETAFWQPHLLTGADGSVTFEFKVPDSVTSWNVWVHAITRDLKSGSVHREARSVKELMVRPYIPRFLREGDQAEIKVVVNNASDHELNGTLNFDIIDVATDQSVLSQFGLSRSDASGRRFTVPKSGGANLAFPIKTPSAVGQIAFKITATSGDFSDGELRPIPILPGRMHLMQSRFVTLKDAGQRVMRFDDLARGNDPTRINEQMVVTLDAQLFYSVLSALPYLVNYPYECTEQTLNRFVSTGILTSLYRQYPAIERMAKEFSSRQTRLERWDAADPNRKMALEETPWLQMAQGGKEDAGDLINVLDSRIAGAQRETALAQLRKSQTSSGGFPWFPGGPPSPYMTLYLLHGFSKALEFGVEVPADMIRPAWNYMHRHYLDDIVRDMVAKDRGWEFVTFINYVLSNYPNSSWYEGSFTSAERTTMLDFSFKHWREHSPYLKGYLALTLKRMERPKNAMLVWESVMDSAKTAEDQGTFWAPEDRAWLWYNDRIETHAFAIRTEMELIPQDPKLDGMVLWLFLNKKLNHWKSTRATAEVIYSLAHYLKETGQLGIREDATVTVGNQRTSFVFEPDQYTGKKNQIVIPGDKIDPKTTSSITVEKTGKGHLFASATWHFSTEQLPEEERGDYLRLTRSFFKRVNTGKEFVLQPLREGAALAPGDEVEVHLSLTAKHPMEYVHVRDPRGAGFEPATNISRHKWDLGISWYEEIRDSGTNFFFEHLPQGEYTFKYRIRAATAGVFKVAPATAQPMYAPEFAAYSTGASLVIAGK